MVLWECGSMVILVCVFMGMWFYGNIGLLFYRNVVLQKCVFVVL